MGNIVDSIGTMLTNGISGTVGSLAKDIRTAITGKEAITSAERQAIQDRLQEIEKLTLQADQAIISGQIEINKAEAMSGSLFKGGWRPAVGWICAFGFLYQFILQPLIPWGVALAARVFEYQMSIPPLPELDNSTLMSLTMGMLGLGGFRTFEKIKGI
jgi:hypothetical protein